MSRAEQGRGPGDVIGIDLGTSHTALSWSAGRAEGSPQVVPIPQWVAARRRAAVPLLPSVLYAPLPGELPEATDWVIGEYARVRSQETRGRAIASAKSWLCHSGVDRLGPILPWGAAEGSEVERLSPVEVSRRLLAFVRQRLVEQLPEVDLSLASIVLTVPASFDQTARKLTVLAAQQADLQVRLLEEPQAAFYAYLGRSSAELSELVSRRGALRVLVCDVGGGTTDLSLIDVEQVGGELSFRRSAVGRHLLLGGDNMDLTLARFAESKHPAGALDAERFGQLLLAARSAKEELLGPQGPATFSLRLLGAGAQLLGGGWSVELERSEVQGLLLDGFFPYTEPGELPTRRSGLSTFGLPYERDPAVTRHIWEFVARHAGGRLPDALLFNGGVMQSPLVQERLVETFRRWGSHDVSLLSAPDPLLAVSQGAVRYGLSLRGWGPRISGGSAHGYYVAVDSPAATRQALCIVPRGSREGERQLLVGQRFEITLGRPARFELYASDTRLDAPGARVELDADFQRLPPVTTELSVAGTDSPARAEVQLDGELSAVGTLELGCTLAALSGAPESSAAAGARLSLAFELRPGAAAAPTRSRAAPSVDLARFREAEASLERVFGKSRKDVAEREVKDLRMVLERSLGPRASWDLELSRKLSDRLIAGQKARQRSEDHERVFWMLLGYCLRPGFGHALDGERMAQLWPTFDAGLSHRDAERSWQQYWIAWRRMAGGLSADQQTRIRELLDPVLAPPELKLKKPKNFRPLAHDELLGLASHLERVDAASKTRLGHWILERTWSDRDPRLWTHLAGVGARIPAYASAHHALRASVVERWVEQLLRERWSDVHTAAASALRLARLSGDQVRDLSARLRAEVAAALERAGAPSAWRLAVLELTPRSEEERVQQLGDDLPLGLRLIEH